MVVGGCERVGGFNLPYTEYYDPVTGEWKSLAKLPEFTKSEYAVCALRNDILVSGKSVFVSPNGRPFIGISVKKRQLHNFRVRGCSECPLVWILLSNLPLDRQEKAVRSCYFCSLSHFGLKENMRGTSGRSLQPQRYKKPFHCQLRFFPPQCCKSSGSSPFFFVWVHKLMTMHKEIEPAVLPPDCEHTLYTLYPKLLL